MRRLAGPMAALLLSAGALLLAPPAVADSPSSLSSQVTDSAGVLDDARARSDVAALESKTGLRLYVVFVDSFDGTSGSSWAAQTAQDSGFGDGQVVLAVATRDRQYGYAGHGDGLTASDIGSLVTDDVRPHLADSDWDGAVSAATTSLTRAAQARQSGTSGSSGSSDGSSSSGSGAAGVVVLLVVLALVALVIALAVRARRRRRTGAGTGAGQVPAAARVPTAELTTQADAALVRTDDAVASSAQELSFARAEFGDEATGGFAAALTRAQSELSAAFAARRSIDDARDAGTPLDEARHRALLQEVLTRTSTADGALAEQAESFTALRDVEHRLPQVLADLRARRDQLEERAPQEQRRLDDLARRWSPAALRPVAGDVEQAQRLLALAGRQIDDAGARADAGASGEAAVVAHAVEGSLTQAATLLDAVAARGSDLTGAAEGLEDAMRETDADLAQARGLLEAGHRDPALSGLVARAAAAREAAAGAAAPTGGVDPLAALRSLHEADAALDAALDAVREAGQQAGRARASLAQALPAARAEVSTTRSYLSTRRGAVGTQPRATLAQAEQLLDEAERTAEADPVSALASAQRADALAEQARTQADDDVDQWNGGPGGFGGFGRGGRGGWGPGGYGGRGWGGGGFGGGGGFEGAVLGGVLGGILGGGLGGDAGSSDRGWGGGGGGDWGGGGFGGDSGGGSGGGDFGGGGGDSGGGSF